MKCTIRASILIAAASFFGNVVTVHAGPALSATQSSASSADTVAPTSRIDGPRIEENRRLARQLLEKMGNGDTPEEIAALCTPNLDFNIPGNDGVLPWVGHQHGRNSMATFVRDSRHMVKRIRFEVTDILADGDRAVILGGLATQIVSTGKVINTAYAIELTFSGGKISSFLMLEDSFATSRAASMAMLPDSSAYARGGQ
ncbi:nuclear transport factor 2 family protein [Dyella silvatica]|uniref:nuclear transport factor 2 family protein n=1 Tax=Dyella silvatica TaxID=2992128 RepID=UPI00224CAEDD|nr:nuclear transport factor 2 family protein [Dyella silvatica]